MLYNSTGGHKNLMGHRQRPFDPCDPSGTCDPFDPLPSLRCWSLDVTMMPMTHLTQSSVCQCFNGATVTNNVFGKLLLLGTVV